MYAISYLNLMDLTELPPHQALLERGLLRDVTQEAALDIAFVSHEWLGFVPRG